MRFLCLACCVGVAFGQGTDTKKRVEDYEVHAQARSAAVGAEFMVHSFSRGEASFLAKDFLVVEVALFPPKGSTFTVQNANFSLRINDKKQVLLPQPPQMVAATMQHPEWDDRPRPEIDGRMGNAGVILGGPPRPSQIPGSNPPGSEPPNRVPIPRDNPSGVTAQPVTADALLLETALVEGEHHAAISGFLYFPFKGKISSIKTLELIFEDATLKLR